MLGDPFSDGISDEQTATLHRLAKALDIAPAAFFDAPVCDLSQTNELLRLWQGITDGQDRAKVLAFVGAISSKPTASGEPLALAHATQKLEDGS